MADRAVEVLRGMGYGGRRREEEAQELSVHVRDLPRPLAPPPAPEPGWEERVREERRIRNAVRRWSEKCDARMKAKAMQAWRTIAWEELNLRRIMRQVRTKLHAWFYETMYSAFEFWKENAQSLSLMRKKTRKVMMWLVKKDVIRALGAWIACWAHAKDWRVCALEGCLQSRAKRYTASEVKSFINSARGAALLHEFSEASAQDLSEKVISSRIDLEALHEHLTVDALTAARIFPSEDQDRAQALIWKLGRLMLNDTSRLDTLEIWNSRMLLSIDIFEDELDNTVIRASNTKQQTNKNTTFTFFNIDMVGSLQDKESRPLRANGERLLQEWAWGYALNVSKTAQVSSVKVLLKLREGNFALVHIFDYEKNEMIIESNLVKGEGETSKWYHFQFMSVDMDGNERREIIQWQNTWVIVASISDRGEQQSASSSNLFYYKEDHHSSRVINSAIIATAGCTSGEWNFNPAPRNIEMQIEFRAAEDFEDEDDGDDDGVDDSNRDFAFEAVKEAEAQLQKLMQEHPEEDSSQEVKEEMDRLHKMIRQYSLDRCVEPFESRVGWITNRRLLFEIPCEVACSYNFIMKEFWFVNPDLNLHFFICDEDGRHRRDMQLVSVEPFKVFSFSFDREGNLFLANNNRSFVRYRPTEMHKSDFFYRAWKVEMQWSPASSICCSEERVFCMFMRGPVVEISKGSGSLLRIFRLNFEVINVGCTIFAMQRLIFVDSDSIKMCKLIADGASGLAELVCPPLGEHFLQDKSISRAQQDFIAKGLDSPAILWDGSFLWVTEAQAKGDRKAGTKTFSWTCYAPMTRGTMAKGYGTRALIATVAEKSEDGRVQSRPIEHQQ